MNGDEKRWSVRTTLMVVVVLSAACWGLIGAMMWGLW